MKKRFQSMLAGLMLLLVTAPSALAEEAKLTVLNPRGTPPPIRLVPMAPRLDTLEGKTVYIIGISFTEPLIPVLHQVLQERYPKTNWVLKNKGGSFFADAPELWEEARDNAQAAIVGVGH